MSKAIYRLNDGGQMKWVHVSEGKKTVVLRWFGPDYTEPEVLNRSNDTDLQRWDGLKRNGRLFSLNEITARTTRLSFSVADLNVKDDADKWAEVFACLNEMGNIVPVQEIQAVARPSVVSERRSPIPLTRMRRFYETMRILNEAGLQQQIAKYLTERERADRIQVMFDESASHFGRYSNAGEAFHNRLNPDWLSAYLDKPKKFARCVVARLSPVDNAGAVEIAGLGKVQIVDYEISPFRTRGGVSFEDGTSGTSSGSGGMDLLLKDVSSGIPIVGEIKAPKDRDLFLALVQSLTYAVELTTAPQMKRLNDHYPQVSFDVKQQLCDIHLIYDKDDKPALMTETKSLAKQLLETANSPVASRVRRISFVNATLTKGRGITLEHKWSTPQSNS